MRRAARHVATTRSPGAARGTARAASPPPRSCRTRVVDNADGSWEGQSSRGLRSTPLLCADGCLMREVAIYGRCLRRRSSRDVCAGCQQKLDGGASVAKTRAGACPAPSSCCCDDEGRSTSQMHRRELPSAIVPSRPRRVGHQSTCARSQITRVKQQLEQRHGWTAVHVITDDAAAEQQQQGWPARATCWSFASRRRTQRGPTPIQKEKRTRMNASHTCPQHASTSPRPNLFGARSTEQFNTCKKSTHRRVVLKLAHVPRLDHPRHVLRIGDEPVLTYQSYSGV